jgi:hypothetical protein
MHLSEPVRRGWAAPKAGLATRSRSRRSRRHSPAAAGHDVIDGVTKAHPIHDTNLTGSDRLS